MRISQSRACLAVRMPPGGLEADAIARALVIVADGAHHREADGSVALIASLPVEVLMKSAPAIMHTRLAWATLRSVASSPVARIVFMCASPQASRKARTSS